MKLVCLLKECALRELFCGVNCEWLKDFFILKQFSKFHDKKIHLVFPKLTKTSQRMKNFYCLKFSSAPVLSIVYPNSPNHFLKLTPSQIRAETFSGSQPENVLPETAAILFLIWSYLKSSGLWKVLGEWNRVNWNLWPHLECRLCIGFCNALKKVW